MIVMVFFCCSNTLGMNGEFLGSVSNVVVPNYLGETP